MVRGQRLGLGLFATAAAFYALAYLAPVSVSDAAVFLLLVALTSQRIRPFLLVLASSVQDAPGMSYLWSYVCFVGIAALLVGDYAIRRVSTLPVRSNPVLERLALFAVIVVAYATAMSALQSHLNGYPQADGRPYVMVGGLMLVMIVTGYVAGAVLGPDPAERRRRRLQCAEFERGAGGQQRVCQLAAADGDSQRALCQGGAAAELLRSG